MIVVNLSGGRSSAMALHLFLVKNNGLPNNAIVCFQNTGLERLETLEFVQKIQTQWEIPILWLEYLPTGKGYKIVDFETAARDGEPFAAMIEAKKYVPNRTVRLCTVELKIKPLEKYMADVHGLASDEFDKVLGIRHDEPNRIAKIRERGGLMPLVDAKITKKQVREFWAKQPFDLKLKDFESNCNLCFQKGKYKRLTILAENPHLAKWWIEIEMQYGQTFHKESSMLELLQYAKTRNFPKALDFFESEGRQLNIIDDTISCFCGD